MKALILKEPGESPDMQVVCLPEPSLTSGGVIVKVAASGICHHDISVMDGTLRRGTKTDVILGHEISGTVVDVGTDVEDINLGDNVVTTLTSSCGVCPTCQSGRDYLCAYGLGYGHGIDGGFAEYIAVGQQNLINVGNIDIEQAALLACPIGVCVKALLYKASLQSYESCAVFGSGGGLGIHAAQVAQTITGNCLAFTSSPDKLEQIMDLGIEQSFLLEEGIDSTDLIMAISQDEGVNVSFNPVGSKMMETSIASLSYEGRALLMGEVTSGTTSPDLAANLIFRNASLIGSTGANKAHINIGLDMVEKGLISPVIGQKFSLEDVPHAFLKMKDRETVGRVVVIP
ncbi:alcohol dehydrogenase catalytic domain-containing protein [Chloroflexi bacterium]|nr:alcohol dehydrogenase catalytic domain-containing protein [Chloroflexota bacterium]